MVDTVRRVYQRPERKLEGGVGPARKPSPGGGANVQRAGRRAGALPLLMALLLAGCATEPYFQPQSSPDQVLANDSSPAEPAKETEKKPEKEPEKPDRPPRPRTLPQAVHAYLQSFHEPLPEPANGKADHAAEHHCGDKNPPANGRGGKAEEPRPANATNSKEGREGEKNPPATGEKDKGNSTNGADDPSTRPARPMAQGKEGEKNPPATGDKEKGDGRSRPGNGEKGGEGKEGEKNPPATGEKDKEKEKENGNGDKGKEEKKEEPSAWFSAHAQATMITQIHPDFPAPYTGPNSLLPNEGAATSLTATLFLDARLWEEGDDSGELIFNPEIAGGRGLSNVFGVAGFPNGEITRVGAVEPTPYIARLYYRQTWGLGGEQEKVEDEANQIAGMRDVDRITLSVGKYAFTDVMDQNAYSHDPRTQFLNWSLMYNGAWDYPANVRGYSYGLALEYNEKDWALRYGVMAEPKVANGAALDPRIDDANGHALEWEGRYEIDCLPGKLRLMAYLNHAHMGNYRLALEEMPIDPNVTLTRAYRIKYGFCANWEQQLTKDLGLFARLGWNDGQTESWAFTAIDRTACLGLLLKGRYWRRPDDTVGLAGVINGLSQNHRDYLAAGGLDFIIGDGRLNYGPEEILETYYDLQLHKGIFVTADFQEISHPAYNRDRGPVSVYSLRVHIEF